MRFIPFFLFSFSLAVCGACSFIFSPRERAHSLGGNNIGDEGARAIKEMFAFNGMLTALYG